MPLKEINKSNMVERQVVSPSAAALSPVGENVISPSKMKERSRSKSNVGKKNKPMSPRRLKIDSRDDAESKDALPAASHLPTPRSSNITKEQDMEPEDSPRTQKQKRLMMKLREPDPSLAELLDVLTDFNNISHLRRVNACGAIKALTQHKANQIPLARTKGVVTGITSVLCAVNASEEERTRCVNALMHLCVPEDNWKLVYLFPQTPEALARNMADKYPQIRYAACLATSFLAKKNRKDVVKNRLLMYAIGRVLEVDKNGALETMSVQDKKVFVGARLCVLKMLLHLSKNKDISNTLARTECVTSTLVGVANTMEVGANILCIATLTNLTRHPDNAYHLVYSSPDLVNTFVRHIDLADAECNKCALFALQNLSCKTNCRQELANMPGLLGSVTKAAFRHDCPEQQLSALHTLKNLSDDPFNLVTMTNTPGCTATLLALANNDKRTDVNGNNTMVQFLACDTLATLSHWLLTLSKTRKSKEIGGEDGFSGKCGVSDASRRTFQQSTWEAWT